ncbi:threonylcarbamoyl-AMP synthase-like [Watersipora subatra]|uniref:threonylcarbamoyl-AMP synthase-like n=1 Tax=Watersipora subatra TaxID=2589382 RepID=UPI00355BB7D2
MQHLKPLILSAPQKCDAKHLLAGIVTLRSGGVIALPTDTIYGIASLAQCKKAVNRIYVIKNRIETKPLAICVGTIPQVYRWCRVTISKALLELLLPGPVTLVFARKAALNPDLNPGNPLVGVRIPDYPLIQDLCRQLDEPLALTSANISSGISTVRTQEFQELWPYLDVIYDGGTLGHSESHRLGSTVVNLSQTGFFTIIRPGSAYAVTRELLLGHGLVEDIPDSNLISNVSLK